LAWQFLQRGDVSRLSTLVERHRPREGQKDLRSFAWAYLHPYTYLRQASIMLAGPRIDAMRYLPNVEHLSLAATERGAAVVCWDTQNNKLAYEAQPRLYKAMVAEVAFLSPDGRLAITGNTQEELKLKNLQTGAEVRLTGQKGSASMVCFSRDDK